jgi:hypothetical protein
MYIYIFLLFDDLVFKQVEFPMELKLLSFFVQYILYYSLYRNDGLLENELSRTCDFCFPLLTSALEKGK